MPVQGRVTPRARQFPIKTNTCRYAWHGKSPRQLKTPSFNQARWIQRLRLTWAFAMRLCYRDGLGVDVVIATGRLKAQLVATRLNLRSNMV
jgi:hypothetical protein